MSETLRLPRQPVIYEINTAIFLSELSTTYKTEITLASVPEEEWKKIAELPVDAVWLMGVWQRSEYSRKVSTSNKELKAALPDFTEKDNLGSAYSVRDYVVDERFGGDKGLAGARKALREHGLGLVLDYAPNHIACDHAWVEDHPEYLVAGTEQDLKRLPHAFYKAKKGVFASGKDPEYPPWADVLQLNAFSDELRTAVAKTITDIAGKCDAIRCDMAMLLVNRVFKQTWGDMVGAIPATEYWPDIIAAVRHEQPDCVLIAEVYWGFERELLGQGFDYCYDKTFYDYLVKANNLILFQYLHLDLAFQARTLRFIENHDEPRAAKTFPSAKHQAAAFSLATLPGSLLYHQGQLAGKKVKLPVHLGRAPLEEPNQDISRYYHQLIAITASSHMRDGNWQLCRADRGLLRSSKLIAWCWTKESARYLCVVNYNAQVADGRIELPSDTPYAYAALFGEQTLQPDSDFIKKNRLHLILQPWGYALFRFAAE